MSVPEEPQLIVKNQDPLNCETRISALRDEVITPNEAFYIRSHFAAPRIEVSSWRLVVEGLVERPLRLSLEDLERMPAQTRTVTLECAGNGRTFLEPMVGGEQWGLGAVGTAVWTGVPLAEVLDRAGPKAGARCVVFKGADGATGERAGAAGRFDRGLTLDEVRDAGVLLAYLMNGERLPLHHGHPLRAIVPGWYGVASVKWLAEIELVSGRFEGHFQTERYVFESEQDGRAVKEPLRHQRVRALITHPGAGDEVGCGALSVRGFAWSGAAPIAAVEVSVNGGEGQVAEMSGRRSRESWQPWELTVRIDKPGPVSLRARAVDEAGHVQPPKPVWNRLGYCNNAIHELAFRVIR